MQKRFNKIYIIIPCGLILLAGAVLLGLYLNGFFYNRKDIQAKAVASPEEIAVLAQDTKIVPADMLSRIRSLLLGKTNTSPFIVSWYALPGTISSVKELQSEYLITTDQINLLRYYIKTGNKDSAKQLSNGIAEDFTGESGFLVSGRNVSELTSLSAPQPVFPANAAYEELSVMTAQSMETTVEYVRALLEYYEKWGQAADWTHIEKLADLLYTGDAGFTEDLTITAAAPSLVPTGENQDIVSAVEGQVTTGGTFTTLSLSSLDLEVFRMLGLADSKYQPMYDKALEILSGALISEDLPLYAIGYSQSSAGYVYYSDADAQADLITSLKITLHLAEEGKASKNTLLWIKEQLYNQGMLYKSYNLISGQATTTEESVEAYGILLQIAREVDDADLYSKALERLEWHLATNSSSKAKSAVFRQLDGSRVIVYANDNLETLLGV